MSVTLDKFLRKRHRSRNNPKKYQEVYQTNLGELEFYLAHGNVIDQVSSNDNIQRQPWEDLSSELSIPRNFYEMVVQKHYAAKSTLPAQVLHTCLDYSLLYGAISYFRQRLAVTRYGRELTSRIASDHAFDLSIAILLSDKQSSSRLFRWLSAGYPLGWINRSNSHLGDVVILLFAASLGQTLAPAVANFAYADVIEHWNSDDLALIERFLNKLCDDQVAQVASPPSKCFFEFDNMNWQFIPYPALTLMKLRQDHGLTNPHIEHPAFDCLNDIVVTDAKEYDTGVADETYQRLMHKLTEQGFDMDTIYRQ